MAQCDEEFHCTLVAAAGNAEMARVHRDVTERIRIIRRLDFTQRRRIDATYDEHAKILRAVIQRKADQAALLLRAHIETSKAEVRKITLHTLHGGARARLKTPAARHGSCWIPTGIQARAPKRHASRPCGPQQRERGAAFHEP